MQELNAIEEAIAALEQQRGVLGDAVVDTALEPLLEKRLRLETMPAGEQRKQVTVLFADVVDFTVLSGRLDPEEMRQVMNEYFAAWRTAIEAEGGVVEKYIGDAVVAVFGLHRAREDDPHRAVRAALAMQRALDALNRSPEGSHGIELAMRVGIDTGEVVISTLDERGDGDYVVVGDRVNRAARIQAAAPPGGIMLSADTGRHIRGSFGLRLVEPLRLKGFADPVEAFVVVSGENQGFWLETRGIEGVTTPTVGRDLELGRLAKLFADAADERSTVFVTVLGDAGIGKSRLVRDFENHLANLSDGVWLLRGRAAPAGEQVPNAVLRGVFAERLGIQDSDDPATVAEKWRSRVGPLLGGDDRARTAVDALAAWLGFPVVDGVYAEAATRDPEALQRRARQTVAEVLRRLGERAPVVVLLEDLHWADGATLDWLEGFDPGGTPLLVVASARPALLERRPHWGEGLRHHTSIRLGALSVRESRQLVDEILARLPEVPVALEALVVDAAEGNPFFIEELVKWLLDTGAIAVAGDRWTVSDRFLDEVGELAVPGTLRGVLQARLDTLDRGHRSVVDRAAVVGRVFWDGAVADLGPEDGAPPPEAYERLRAHEVVFQRPTSVFEGTKEFSFRHSLMREVAYENVLHSVRRRYHRLAAGWLERMVTAHGRPEEHAAVIAGHHRAAGDQPAAAEWYLRAGRHAAGIFANEDALRLLRSARDLATADDGELRFEILMAIETVLDRAGDRDEQRRVLDELAATPGLDGVRRARLLLCEGRWHFYHGEYQAVLPLVDEAADLARRAGEEELEIEAMALGGKSLAFRPDHEAARARLSDVVRRTRASGDNRMLGEGLRLLAVVATNLGESERAVDLLGQARDALHEVDDLEGEGLVAGQLGATYIQMGGHQDEAREALEEAMAMFVAAGHRLRQGIVQGNLVAIAIEQGRLDDALGLGTENLVLAREVEDMEGVVAAGSRLGEIHRYLGDLAAARQVLDETISVGRRMELHYFVAFSLAALAQVDLADARVVDAVAHAGEAEEAAARSGAPHAGAFASLVAGMALHRAGDLEPAVARLRRAVEDLEALDRPGEARWCEALLADALLDAGETEEARRLATGVLPLVRAGEFSDVEGPLTLLALHRVLAAVDPRAAAEVAAAVARFVTRASEAIADESVRRALLDTAVYRALTGIAATAA